jgi:Baseplate J-like protein
VPLAIPNLDNLAWKELVAEGRTLIPAFAPAWTNHNEADPGITLIELAAYITDLLLYRVNQIGETHLRHFLQLIRGPAWKPSGAPLQTEIRRTVLSLADIDRAVTPEDYEALALASNHKLKLSTNELVSRVKCIPRRNLENSVLAAQTEDVPGSVSLVVVPNRRAPASTQLLRAVRTALEPARLLTTRIHVVSARYVTFSVRIKLVVRPGARADAVKAEAIAALDKFFDPWQGGFDQKGWPFGRSIYVSEIYELLNKVSDVDYATRTRNPQSGDEMSELVVGAAHANRVKWNEAHEAEAVELYPNELPVLWIDVDDIEVTE